jgi:hypothetical protein
MTYGIKLDAHNKCYARLVDKCPTIIFLAKLSKPLVNYFLVIILIKMIDESSHSTIISRFALAQLKAVYFFSFRKGTTLHKSLHQSATTAFVVYFQSLQSFVDIPVDKRTLTSDQHVTRQLLN